MKQVNDDHGLGGAKIGQAAPPPPPPPPPPPLPWFWARKAVPESVTKQEIAKFWRQKRIEEEDHLLAAIKAAARIRAHNLSEEDYKYYEEYLKDTENEAEEKKTAATSDRNKVANSNEIRVGRKDWWTKSKYAYLNQPAIESKSPHKRRTSTYIPNRISFEHAFDTEKLLASMDKLRNGQAVDIPKYDFKSYKNNVFPPRRVNPSDVIILEGILIFHDPRVRELMNMKIFVDTDADVRLARRIRRDTVDKHRDIGAVLDQYSKFVKPAFDDFILPTKKYADIIIPRGGDNHVAIDLIVQHIRTKLGQHDLCKIYPNLYVIQSTFQIRGMHTLIRDSQTTKHDFVFYSDRLIRLVVEHGLGHLPFTEKQVTTPTGSVYTGVDFCKRLCGVSVIRSGESMENALRACCKGIKIGKILIHREGDNGQQLIYEKLPQDISDRHVLLLDPILGTGNSAVQAISLILRKGVPESNIIFLNLISAPQGIHVVCKRFPRIKIVTSEIEIGLNEDFRVIPGMGEFGDRYFGTDDE